MSYLENNKLNAVANITKDVSGQTSGAHLGRIFEFMLIGAFTANLNKLFSELSFL